jgi:heme-degrading monooxygenase HmoA
MSPFEKGQPTMLLRQEACFTTCGGANENPLYGHAERATSRRLPRTFLAEKRLLMILEAAILNIRPGQETAFESAFREAKPIIASMPGFISLELQKCLEEKSRYLLLVKWQKLEDHTVGFRQSPEYQHWKNLLHHFYEPFSTVEHYEKVSDV